jgi:hypothetical protein
MINDELIQALKDRQVILFAGAGTSVGVGAPTWSGLIDKIGRDLGYESDVFRSISAGNYLAVAEYYKIKTGEIGPLRSWMDKEFAVERLKLENSAVHQAILDLDFPIIYTTNYDRNFENAFDYAGKKYFKISNIKHIPIAYDATQIVKFHGDFDDDNSIVLTESDYFRRLTFDTPLDIKLRADSLGRSLLFIGYSLSDINIRLLLFKLWNMWRDSGFDKDRPKSYVFLARPDEVQSTILEEWGVQTISSEVDHPGEALTKFLSSLVDAISD